jgi:putative FmdB family regulatory protein
MPVYEYRCADCSTTFEKLIRNSEQKPGACPSCGKEQVSRVFSTFAVNVAASSSAPRCENPRPGCGRCST